VLSAGPSGAPRLVEWNTGEHVGKTAVLEIEDTTQSGALAVDEVASY
jgi:hypothetical protein